LQQLSSPDIPDNLLATLDAREATLVAAWRAARQAGRAQRAATQAAALMQHRVQAQQAVQARRAKALARGTAAL
jgi:hypothetical protein